ncbi:DNA primase small subunit PriS [Candidatus Bathyarchaeota archaeon]|nr:DNA primase small subunit PriS [Candidatus Bathyarchaeota archaeon]
MSKMPNLAEDFVKKMFLKYYSECFDQVCIPNLFKKREFGGLLSKERIMIRHRKIETAAELQEFLCSIIPSDVYFSSAYYEQPDAPEMNSKGWFGADLIFDVDADHLSTPCDKIHDDWICSKCGFAGKGISPEKCPVCNSEKFDVKTWPCELCVNAAKEEIIKLLEMLKSDFGFSDKEVHVFFSGHRGYHIHVEDDSIRTLDSVARKEIVDYVCGLGLTVAFGRSRYNDSDALNLLRTLRLSNYGWRGRIAQGVYNFISNAAREDYQNIGLKKNFVEAILANRNMILKNWREKGTLPLIKGVGVKNWSKIAEHCARVQSANVDTVVTTDIHRLIRLAGTLHGKTALKKMEFQPSEIEDFDPFKDAIAFKDGSTSVLVHSAPEFRLGDITFGPYKSEKVELPTAAALLLVCKNRAEVVSDGI